MSTGIWAWWIWARKVSARSQGEEGGLTTYTKLVALEGIFPSPATTCDDMRRECLSSFDASRRDSVELIPR